MDSKDVARIVGSDMTVSDKIRALAAAGYPRAEIARVLGKRYQHVRNVLEADRLHGRPAGQPAGVAEPGRRFERQLVRDVEHRGRGIYRLAVRDDGSVVLPLAVQEALGLKAGVGVIARLKGEVFELISGALAWREIDEILAPYRKDGVSWADELIADRRHEAAREERDD